MHSRYVQLDIENLTYTESRESLDAVNYTIAHHGNQSDSLHLSFVLFDNVNIQNLEVKSNLFGSTTVIILTSNCYIGKIDCTSDISVLVLHGSYDQRPEPRSRSILNFMSLHALGLELDTKFPSIDISKLDLNTYTHSLLTRQSVLTKPQLELEKARHTRENILIPCREFVKDYLNLAYRVYEKPLHNVGNRLVTTFAGNSSANVIQDKRLFHLDLRVCAGTPALEDAGMFALNNVVVDKILNSDADNVVRLTGNFKAKSFVVNGCVIVQHNPDMAITEYRMEGKGTLIVMDVNDFGVLAVNEWTLRSLDSGVYKFTCDGRGFFTKLDNRTMFEKIKDWFLG